MRRASLALLFLAGSGLAVACSACRRGSGEGESAPPAAASGAANASAAGSVAPKAAGSAGGASSAASSAADVAALLWANAKDGDEEDVMALATHEGAAGLAAAGRAGDADRRTIALRAAPSARGYAHVPWLAEVAETGGEEDAKLALEALADVGARVRRAEEHDDVEELAAGCAKLAALAKNADKARPRRIGAVRAVRTLPCPKLELPPDLDAR